MKIRHFLLYGTLDPKYGGPTYSIPIQCIGTQRLGCQMSFVVSESSKPWEGKLIDEGVEMINLPDPKSSLEHSFAVPLFKYLKKCEDYPDIIHIHGVWMPEEHYAASFARKHNIPYVINPRGDMETARMNYNRLKKIKKMFAWKMYAQNDVENAACIITTSQQELEGVRKLGVKTPIAIIPNGIELNAFPKEVVHKHGDKKVLLFLSRINPIKGLEFLLEAWSKLPSYLLSEWELHIAGNSDPKDYIYSLKEKVKKLSIQDTVKFIGPITGEAKLQKYQNSNLFVLPTLNENFGNVVAEAMMCECPVITTTNAPWSCLNEDKCGWWIDLSIENLQKTLVDSMSLSDEERHELGKKSRKCIITRYSAESVAKKTYRLYEWVLGLADKPDFVTLE